MTIPVTITHAGREQVFNLTEADLDNLPHIVAGALAFLAGHGVSSESPEYLEALASAREQLGAGAGEEAEAFLATLDEEPEVEDDEAESEDEDEQPNEDEVEELWLDDDDPETEPEAGEEEQTGDDKESDS